jgi:hypothetical protein
MKRLPCGSVVLAASLGLVSCNGDPTGEFRNGPSQILAEPSTIFVDQGREQDVITTVIDSAGDPLASTWELTETGPGITVERNPDFLGTTAGAPLESQAQFIVTAGDTPTASSFTVTAGELSREVTVNVMPTAVPSATFSNLNPALNEPVTLTAEGYTFLPNAEVVISADSAVILSNDGTSITFVPFPGGVGPANLQNVAINFLPTTPLSLLTTDSITVPPGPVAGTLDPSTAPSLITPALDTFSVFFDMPDFLGPDPTQPTIDHFYELTVTETGQYVITVDWDIGTDIDLLVCLPDLSDCPLTSFVNHPEKVRGVLTPGTYIVWVEDFTGAPPEFGGTGVPDAVGATVEILVEHNPVPATIVRQRTSTTDARKLQRLLKR